MSRMIAVPLLIGAGFLIGIASIHTAHGQINRGGGGRPGGGGGARPPVNRPQQRPQVPNHGQMNRPAARPSVPTPSRPQQRPQMPQQRPNIPQQRPQMPQQRPAIGHAPNLPGAGGGAVNRPAARPVTPNPVNPSVRPNIPNQPIQRPAPLPGGIGGGGGVQRPTPQPNLPINRPGGNSNVRPGVLPNRPDVPTTRPGTLPNRPETRPAIPGNTLPNRPPIGTKPTLPDRPGAGGGGIQRPTPLPAPIPGRPGEGGGGIQRPTPLPGRPGEGGGGIQRPVPLPGRPGEGGGGIQWPNRPGPDRPGQGGGGEQWQRPDWGGGNRPNVDWRPGIRPDGSHNTIINRPNNSNNVNINNIHNHNNYFNNQNFNNFNNYRPGFGNAVYGWNNAWYGNFNTWHQHNHPWYHGAWCGNMFNSWGVGAVSWGLGMWGLNSMRYSFGYMPYVNPFYVPPVQQTVVVPQYDNYSQPIINVTQALPDTGSVPPPMPETAAQSFDLARTAFQKGDYNTALVKTELALKDFPNDPVLHEFRALVQFAMGQYRQASATIHALLASGPGWDWTTMSSLYADVNTYSAQLAALEKAAAAKPDDPALQFLLAYHYMTAANADAAKVALTNAQRLMPNDPVVAQLAEAAGVEAPANQAPPAPMAADIQLDITGNWTATRADGGTIGLATTKEGGFTWTITDKGGKKDSFDGTFRLEDDMLILERKSGGALMGQLTPLAANKFNFKVLGGAANDPGLNFAK